MTSRLIPYSNCEELDISKTDYVVFGGTFDPFHIGHLDAVQLLEKFFTKIIIAPTSENPWKTQSPSKLEDRVQIVKLVLEAEKKRIVDNFSSNGIYISDYPYQYSEELIQSLRNKVNSKIYWAVSEDIAETVSNWRNWDKLEIETIVLPINIAIHATEIREGKKQLHPAIVDYVVQNQLYA